MVGQVTPSERGELARRIEHLRHRRVRGIEVADCVGQHGGDACLMGEPQHPGRVGGAAGPLVIDDLDHGLGPLSPAGQGGRRAIGPPGGDRPPDVAGRAEQHDQPLGVIGYQILGYPGNATLARSMRGADQAAQRGPAPSGGFAGSAVPAGRAEGEQRHPGCGLVRQPRRPAGGRVARTGPRLPAR